MSVTTPPQPQPTTTTSATVTTNSGVLAQLFGNGYLISVIVIVGLIVLMALNKVSVPEGLPPLLALAGVHLGASVSTP